MLKSQRGKHITTDRLFLTVNPSWKNNNSKGFFKNCPVGRNEISKWTKEAAELIGVDTKKIKVTNHSNRAAAVTQLAKIGITEHEIVNITGHSSTSSIKSYLQVDGEHHESIIHQMRMTDEHGALVSKDKYSDTPKYSHCTFNNCSFFLK